MADDGSNSVSAVDKIMRDWIGVAVSIFAFLTVIVLGAFALGFTYIIFKAGPSSYDKGLSTLQYVFGALLPLVATWMGTVLAFYFGSKNFEAANKSMQDIVKKFATSDDKLKSINVLQDGAMIALKDIVINHDIDKKAEADILIKKDLIDFINSNKKGERLPILDNNNILRYIIHKSTLTDFAFNLSVKKYPKIADKTPETATLADAINSSDSEMLTSLTKGAAFVSKAATVFDVQQKIINNSLCQDVFVTETGKDSEPIIGWITNSKIEELAKV